MGFAIFWIGHNMGHFEPIFLNLRIKSAITDD